MTVTIAYIDKKNKHAYLGADSCASDAVSKSVVNNNKVFHPVGRKDVLIGCAGTFRLQNILQYCPDIFPGEDELDTEDINMNYLVNVFSQTVKELTEDFDDTDTWGLLIAVGDRIYQMQMDLSVIEPSEEFETIGIGGQVAIGALKVLNELVPEMSIEDKIKKALEVTCSACQGCSPPFSIMKTEDSSGHSEKRHTMKRIKKATKRKMFHLTNAPETISADSLLKDFVIEVEPEKPKKTKEKKKKK